MVTAAAPSTRTPADNDYTRTSGRGVCIRLSSAADEMVYRAYRPGVRCHRRVLCKHVRSIILIEIRATTPLSVITGYYHAH